MVRAFATKLAISVIGATVLCSVSLNSMAEGIAVIVNVDNPNSHLTRNEIINIFMGRYRQFPNGLSANPLDNADLKNDFYLRLVNKSIAEINAYWARLIFSGRTQPPDIAIDETSTVLALTRHVESISYIPLSKVNRSVKVVFFLGDINDAAEPTK